MNRRSILITIFAAIGLSVGYLCLPHSRGDRPTLRGRVTLDGENLKDGMIAFIPEDKWSNNSAGANIVDGDYVIDKKHPVPPGKYRVEIYSYEGCANIPTEIPRSRVPASWNRESEHFIVVTAGDGAFDFAVDSSD